MISKETKERMKKYGFGKLDKIELTRLDKPVEVAYPKPIRRFRLVQEMFNQSIEEMYFWAMGHMRDDWGFHDVKKITDVFTASEQSAFWGAAQQRLQIQQGQVMSYMQSIGKMMKELFQLVREMRILDERLELYDESAKKIKEASLEQRKTTQAAEITLRGYWVDLKDGGAKSPSSVYGMSSQLGFSILPDLFFSAPPMKSSEVDRYVDSLDFNRKVKEVLKRKLKAFIIWKDHTHSELKNRSRFTLKYLRQHYNVIQTYINWVKPYLRNVKRLGMNEKISMSEDIIGSFEGSVVEIEVLGTREFKGDYKPVILMSIYFRTRPSMDFHQDGYQHKGPIHVGRTEMTLRGYVWKQEEIDNYLKMKEEETMELIGEIDQSLKASIDNLGDDLRNYLKKAGEKFPEDIKAEEEKKKKEEEARRKQPGFEEPFVSVLSGFKEIFTAFSPGLGMKRPKKEKQKSQFLVDKEKGAAKKNMENVIWNVYKNFKKAHGMLSW